MTPHQINSEYFDWLVSQIRIAGQVKRTYNGLFDFLHHREFECVHPRDENRVQDARDLRDHFSGGRKTRTPDLEFVSVLEVIIAVSRKAAFVAGGPPKDWAWILIDNLGLVQFHDPLTHHYVSAVESIVQNLLARTYRPDGYGGFFPLNYPKEDQRQIEIWHQLNEYVNEIQQPS